MNHTGSNPQNNPQTSTVAIIPARFASSRLPRKALLDIDGQPMILWVIRRTLEARNVSRVIVATDSHEILEAVINAGYEAEMTDANHNSGTDRIAEVAAKIDDAGIIVNVQGDEPLIAPKTIELAVDQMMNEIAHASDVGIVTTWEPIHTLRELLDSSVVKVVVSDDDTALYFSRSPMPFPRDATQRHGDPNIALELEPELLGNFKKHTGLYVYRRETLLEFTEWPQTKLEQFERLEQLRALEHGVKIRVIQASGSSIGVDTPEDLERVRRLVAEEKVTVAHSR
ncbi:MAG: 3-deoxy-manno-octulosonate cytidylyltransferase [Blastocatellia bacterium]|nr:MAG: 3-deoxy-manno-octulosonate cytidylyltransferase [Blastocatellia bacterium]